MQVTHRHDNTTVRQLRKMEKRQEGKDSGCEERKEKAGCPRCTKVFRQFGFLQQHMLREHKVHPRDCRARINVIKKNKTEENKDGKTKKMKERRDQGDEDDRE